MVCSLCKGSCGSPDHNKRTCPLAKSSPLPSPDPSQKELKGELLMAINLLGKSVTYWDDLGVKNHIISGGRWWLTREWKDEEDIQVQTKCDFCPEMKHRMDFAKPRSWGGRAGRAFGGAPYVGWGAESSLVRAPAPAPVPAQQKEILCEYCEEPEAHLYPCCQRSCCSECREEGPSPIIACPFCCD